MKILFISRKRLTDWGGLARFTQELTSNFPSPYYLLTPSLTSLISLIPHISLISHIHLCDATLLPLGVLLKLIFRKPLTLTIHGLDITYPNRLYQTILIVLLSKADTIILDSQAALPLISKFNLPKEKVFIINPGISITYLNSPNHPYLPNLPNLKGKLILLTVGNLVLRKGHVWFIRKVLRKLPSQFIYIVVGEGEQREDIERTIKRLRLNSRVFLPGALPHPQLAYIYHIAHIYVCPNQQIEGDFEGFGLAAGEAAAMGLPVVASAIDGIPEVIKDGKNGILVEPTPQAFITAIIRLKNPNLRKKLGQKAKIYTRKNYSWQKAVKKYTKVFEKLTIL